jgi:hypothetical protein
MPKLNAVGLAITVVKPHLSQDNWKMVYYSYYHTMKIIEEYFGKNSAQSINIFRWQKKGNQNSYGGARSRYSCRDLFKN